METNHTWIKIAGHLDELSFLPTGIAVLTVQGKQVCIVKTTKGMRACAARCPHAGGNLAEGFAGSRDTIICPVHYYKFSLHTGREIAGGDCLLKLYSLKETAEGVFINIL